MTKATELQASKKTIIKSWKIGFGIVTHNQQESDAAWQGPYITIQKIEDVNYVIDMDDKKKRQRIFNINMLIPWNTADNVTYRERQIRQQ